MTTYVEAVVDAINHVDEETVNKMAKVIRGANRLFILGVGGCAADALHAAADFRHLCGVEAYAATGNVAELTATANDVGLDNTFRHFLIDSNLTVYDCVMVLSVGGGTATSSNNISCALDYAKWMGTGVVGIVGPRGGETARLGKPVIKVKAPKPYVTPVTHAVQAMVLHWLFTKLPRPM